MVISRSQCSVTTSIVATPRLESPRIRRSTRSMMAIGSVCAAAGAAAARPPAIASIRIRAHHRNMSVLLTGVDPGAASFRPGRGWLRRPVADEPRCPHVRTAFALTTSWTFPVRSCSPVWFRLARQSSPSAPLGAQPILQESAPRSPRRSTATPRPPIVAFGSAWRPTNPTGVRAVPRRLLARPSSPSAPLGAQPTLQESAPFYGADSWRLMRVAARAPTGGTSPPRPGHGAPPV